MLKDLELFVETFEEIFPDEFLRREIFNDPNLDPPEANPIERGTILYLCRRHYEIREGVYLPFSDPLENQAEEGDLHSPIHNIWLYSMAKDPGYAKRCVEEDILFQEKCLEDIDLNIDLITARPGSEEELRKSHVKQHTTTIENLTRTKELIEKINSDSLDEEDLKQMMSCADPIVGDRINLSPRLELLIDLYVPSLEEKGLFLYAIADSYRREGSHKIEKFMKKYGN